MIAKKIAAIAGAGILMAASTGMVFAGSYHHSRGEVTTTMSAGTNTGGNTQYNNITAEDIHNKCSFWCDGEAEVKGDNHMRTGDSTARTRAGVVVKSERTAKVTTTMSSSAVTGGNTQDNGVYVTDDIEGEVEVNGDNHMSTGDATATTNAFVVVGGHYYR